MSEIEFISKTKYGVLAIYLLCPIIVSIIYWFEEPVPFSLDLDILLHSFASILGIFSYIWMCFGIITMIKLKVIEKKINLDWLIKFHTYTTLIALLFGSAHALILYLTREFPDNLLITGLIGLLIFCILIVLAVIFMTNRLINSKKIRNLRESAYKKVYDYGANKILHNITLLAVFFIFVHTVLSYTALSSIFIRGVYFSFFILTLIGWVTHKLVRRLRLESDPYANRKASWDIQTPEIFQEPNNEWAMNIIKEQPSLYPCLQCGTCTVNCPVSIVSKGKYNPRSNILNVLFGLKDAIFLSDIITIWGCTLCDTCDEVCPQKVELTEIFTFLKNESTKRGDAPDNITGQVKAIFETAKAVPLQPSIMRRRISMGLPTITEPDVNEVQTLLKNIGVDKKLKQSEGN
jgi:heterodisulfide reductase subunit C